MILSVSNQTILFLSAVAAGFGIGALYDVFRVFRKILPHPGLFVQFEDIVFWTIATLGVFYLMLDKSFGEIRAFSIFGIIIGVVLYFSTVSVIVMKAATAIIHFVKKIIFKVILAPFRLLARLLKPVLNFARRKVNKFFTNVKNLLHKLKNYARIRTRSLKRQLKIITKKI